MGSNSFRLVVYGYEPNLYWQHVDEIREAVRVGQGMGDKGVLQREPMERAVRTAHVFGSFCRAAHIDEVMPVATSAIRSARNGRELLDRIKRESGLDARVLDEREEARYGYLAIANSTTIEDGFGIDIGGGSVQAMRLEKRRLEESALLAARRRARERGVPSRRRRGKPETAQGAPQAREAGARGG